MVVVTSSGPGEGKTIVASNLAIGFAYAGQRVLLVDGDLRRPRVHEVFAYEQEPGLSNVLVGDAKASDAVRRDRRARACACSPPAACRRTPAELLGSRRFKELLASIRDQFDWVVIDSPPVMAVTDPNILANLADSVVFVIGAEMTSYKIARRAVEQLERGRAVFAGRRAEQGADPAPRLLLLAVLPARVRQLLRGGRTVVIEWTGAGRWAREVSRRDEADLPRGYRHVPRRSAFLSAVRELVEAAHASTSKCSSRRTMVCRPMRTQGFGREVNGTESGSTFPTSSFATRRTTP